MTRSLSLINGPTFFEWDGEFIFDLLTAVETIPLPIRANLVLSPALTGSITEHLSSLDVKATDVFGMCLCGPDWDHMEKLSKVAGLPHESDKAYIAGKLVNLSGSTLQPIYTREICNYLIKIERVSDSWIWNLIKPGGKIVSSGETQKLTEAISEIDASLNLLTGEVF